VTADGAFPSRLAIAVLVACGSMRVVATPGDTNCCPSLELPFSLRLVDEALVLRDAAPLRPTPDR